MKALLYKDFRLLWLEHKSDLLAIAISGIIDTFFKTCTTHSFSFFIAFLLVKQLLREEENCHWLAYVDTTSVDRKNVVTEKYLLNLFILSGTVIFHGLFRVLAGFIHGDMCGILLDYSHSIISSFVAAFLLNMLYYPFLFRDGTEKGGRGAKLFIALAVIIVIIGKVSTAIGSILRVQDKELAGSIVCIVLSLTLSPLSWRQSVRWYQERDLV